jgi:tetratricopeptide (TPR) repeat protein
VPEVADVLQNASRLAVLLVILLPAAAISVDPPANPPTKEQIAEWIKGLGSDSFEDRERASEALWKAGKSAEPALRQVLKSGDKEAVRRAREILDKFDWDLYPDTPEAVVALIGQYRAITGKTKRDEENKWDLLEKFLDHGTAGYEALMKMKAAEIDREAQHLISESLVEKMPRLAGALMAEGKEARLEEIVEQTFQPEDRGSLRLYVAYFLETGKLDHKLREWQKKAGPTPDPKIARLLAVLCRAKGDLNGALKYAEQAHEPGLVELILFEKQDWKELCKKLERSKYSREQALRATLLRLMGDREGFDAELGILTRDPDFIGVEAMITFILNGRSDDALAWQPRNTIAADWYPMETAKLLGTRLRWREALEMANRAKTDNPLGEAEWRIARAEWLARLGERKKALEVYQDVAKALPLPKDYLFVWMLLVLSEYKAGFKDEACAIAASLVEAYPAGFDQLSDRLFGSVGFQNEVAPWWKFLAHKFPKDGPAATIKRLRDLFERKLSHRETEDLFNEMAESALKLPANEREASLRCVAETCRTLGRDDLLEGYLEKWAKADGGSLAWLYLGDLSADNKRWADAAERYKRAWDKDRRIPLTLYLHGHALVQAGQEKAGRHWMEAAQVLALHRRRDTFAQDLFNRGFKEAADQEWDRFSRLTLSPLSSSEPVRWRTRKALAAGDYHKAALCARDEALSNLWGHCDDRLDLLTAEHRYRARALAAEGKLDDMQKEIDTVLAVMPDIDLAIEVVPELTKRGHKKEADHLFTRVYKAYVDLCKEYPKSPWAHDNTAWLAVRCRRDLDAALDHARKATELDPETPRYLETLAEVHFQRGDKDKAIELMKKCVQMQPRSVYFRMQLKRMQSGNRDADVPPDPSRSEDHHSSWRFPGH